MICRCEYSRVYKLKNKFVCYFCFAEKQKKIITKTIPCDICGGTGEINDEYLYLEYVPTQTTSCLNCGGKGSVIIEKEEFIDA